MQKSWVVSGDSGVAQAGHMEKHAGLQASQQQLCLETQHPALERWVRYPTWATETDPQFQGGTGGALTGAPRAPGQDRPVVEPAMAWAGNEGPGATKQWGSGVCLDRFPSPVPEAPLRPSQEWSSQPPNPVAFHVQLTWRTVTMRVRAGVGGRTVVPQGGVPFTAVRGGK